MSHLRPFLLVFCIAIALHPAIAGADCKVLPAASVETTLSNGLRLIVVPTGLPKVVSLQISVEAGPRIETESGKSGLAHVVEQLVARGTGAAGRPKSYTADD